MPLIKRYPNRKLYDTEAKQYITLEGIADLIRQGEEVRVVDNASGEDLTALTLSQVIFELEKKQSGFLPRSVLAGLIQAGGGRFSVVQRTLAASLGLGHLVDEEIKRRILLLVSREELSAPEGQNLLEKLHSGNFIQEDAASEPHLSIRPEDVERYLAEHEVPTRNDLKALYAQLEELAEKIDEVHRSREQDG